MSAPFQSAPLTGARGDPITVSQVRSIHVFQSAPLTGARGDAASAANDGLWQVSIRSPDRSQGRPVHLTNRG